jgi:hypothetical protein
VDVFARLDLLRRAPDHLAVPANRLTALDGANGQLVSSRDELLHPDRLAVGAQLASRGERGLCDGHVVDVV